MCRPQATRATFAPRTFTILDAAPEENRAQMLGSSTSSLRSTIEWRQLSGVVEVACNMRTPWSRRSNNITASKLKGICGQVVRLSCNRCLGDMLCLKNPFDERGATLAPLPQCRDNQAALFFAIKSPNGFVACWKSPA